MIKLACNYYPEAKQLVKEKEIALDYFKYPGLGYQMNVFVMLNLYHWKMQTETLF